MFFSFYLGYSQIGTTWMITAAHCLYIEEELLAASSFFVVLGVHDRSKLKEAQRFGVAGGTLTKIFHLENGFL